MKKKLTALLAALALLAGLTAPAGAISTTTVEDEGWRTYSGPYIDNFVSSYIAQHPEELAAFDADAYFTLEYGGMNKTGFMESNGIDEAGFRYRCWWESVNDKARRSYNAYVTECYEMEFPGELETVGLPLWLNNWGCTTLEERAQQYGGHLCGDVEGVRLDISSAYIEYRRMVARDHDATLKYREQYPGSWETFDPADGYTEEQKQDEMRRFAHLNEEEWKESKYASYMYYFILEQEEADRRVEYFTRWPEEYLDFDPVAWFMGGFYGQHWTPERYMELNHWDAETFKREMFIEWMEKRSGFYDSYCVMVNGAPIQFHRYPNLENLTPCPKVENERILIPLRAAAEALGLTVEWKPETHQVVCANETTTVIFTLDSTEYSGGTLDTAPFAENGVTYLPLRALGETLGCGVTWYQDFATAALTTAK